MHTHMHIHTCIHTYAHTCIYTCMHAHTHTHTHTHTVSYGHTDTRLLEFLPHSLDTHTDVSIRTRILTILGLSGMYVLNRLCFWISNSVPVAVCDLSRCLWSE